MNKLLATYKILIENAGTQHNKWGDMEIEILLDLIDKDNELTENQKDELFEFGDNHKVHD